MSLGVFFIGQGVSAIITHTLGQAGWKKAPLHMYGILCRQAAVSREERGCVFYCVHLIAGPPTIIGRFKANYTLHILFSASQAQSQYPKSPTEVGANVPSTCSAERLQSTFINLSVRQGTVKMNLRTSTPATAPPTFGCAHSPTCQCNVYAIRRRVK